MRVQRLKFMNFVQIIFVCSRSQRKTTLFQYASKIKPCLIYYSTPEWIILFYLWACILQHQPKWFLLNHELTISCGTILTSALCFMLTFFTFFCFFRFNQNQLRVLQATFSCFHSNVSFFSLVVIIIHKN